MTAADLRHKPEPGADRRLTAQALVALALAIPATGVGWLASQGDDWFAPAMVLIVAARFAYDHFFTTAS